MGKYNQAWLMVRFFSGQCCSFRMIVSEENKLRFHGDEIRKFAKWYALVHVRCGVYLKLGQAPACEQKRLLRASKSAFDL